MVARAPHLIVAFRLRSLLRLVLAGGILAASLLLSACGTPIPDLRGMTVPQAAATLERVGLSLGTVAYNELPSPTGRVIWQSPAPNEHKDSGTAVDVEIAGPPPVTVPELVGLSRDAAAARLHAVGLNIGSITETASADVAPDMVVAQAPVFGVETTRGASVAIVLTSRLTSDVVPTVLGLTESNAKELLQAVGFSASVRRTYNKAKKGTVTGQDPHGGTAAALSTPVRLTVSKGPKPVVAPKPTEYRGILAVWAPNSRGVFDPRTGYAYVDIAALGGIRVRARCPYRGLGEGSRVWIAKQAGSWVVTRPR